MTFQEACEALGKGGNVSREAWRVFEQSLFLDGESLCSEGGSDIDAVFEYQFTIEDIRATDWFVL